MSECAAAYMEDCIFEWISIQDRPALQEDIDTAMDDSILDPGFVYTDLPVEQFTTDGEDNILPASRAGTIPFLSTDDPQFAELRAVRLDSIDYDLCLGHTCELHRETRPEVTR